MIGMSTQRNVGGRPSKGDRSHACTRLPQPVRADVDVLASSHPGLLGEIVAALAEAGLKHVDQAKFAPSPADAVPTWTRLPRPVRDEVDVILKANPKRSIGAVVAALVEVGLRHLDDAPLPKQVRQEVLMTAS